MITGAASFPAFAQKVVRVNDSIAQHIFIYDEVEVLRDTTNQLTFKQITSRPYADQFRPSTVSTPQTKDLNAAY